MAEKPESFFATEFYLSAKAHWKGLTRSKRSRKAISNDPVVFKSNRDPLLLSSVLGSASIDFGWKKEISQAKIISEWAGFIGSKSADHTQIIEIRDGLIVIQCDSTAWATELRRLRAEIVTRLRSEYPDSGITELKFVAPGAPSWKHGPRSVPGRGPRDTYG